MKKPPKTIDQYLRAFPKNVQRILQKIRQTIRRAAPDAIETISYQIPTFKLNGKYLIYFAGHKEHIGLYPVTSGMKSTLKKELSPYIKGKGTVQFPLDEPIPYDLVKRIVAVRIKENLASKK